MTKLWGVLVRVLFFALCCCWAVARSHKPTFKGSVRTVQAFKRLQGRDSYLKFHSDRVNTRLTFTGKKTENETKFVFNVTCDPITSPCSKTMTIRPVTNSQFILAVEGKRLFVEELQRSNISFAETKYWFQSNPVAYTEYDSDSNANETHHFKTLSPLSNSSVVIKSQRSGKVFLHDNPLDCAAWLAIEPVYDS